MERRIPRVLSIAGSDSGGGAGIQADLKAFAAAGAHGMTAITAITAQNTVGVTAIHHVPGDVIVAQIAAIVDDIGVDAVKIGMLGTVETIEAVRDGLALLPESIPVVLDPVMVSESGAQLLEPAARLTLVREMLPRITVVTPNLPEARAIIAAAGQNEANPGDDGTAAVSELAESIRTLGAGIVVITGGHRESGADLFYDGTEPIEISGPRHAAGAAHGSGCTHASILAARLAWGDDPLTAARVARGAAAQAVVQGLREIGAGPGPVDVLGLAGRGSLS
jgi:hydroxymethylpyrimidine/phosphomethylpyrimidine kinase